MEIALRAQRAGASLARWLAPWTFVDWSAARVTSELTRAVVAWGAAHRWRVRREVPSLAGLPGDHPDRPGYLDVVCERLDGPPIAIEIDRTDKQWSARKLLIEADAGVVPVWVRWGEAGTWIVPPPVALVIVETTCRRDGSRGRRLYSRTVGVGHQSVPGMPPAPSPGTPQDAQPTLPPAAPVPPACCAATTKKGLPCPIDPRPSGLCHVHDPAVQCGALTKKGKVCTVATGGGRCKYHLNQAEAQPLPHAP